MIVHFTPSDMNTFRATFNKVEIVIHKQPNNSWKIFAGGKPVKKGHRATARQCMEYVESVAQSIVTAGLVHEFMEK